MAAGGRGEDQLVKTCPSRGAVCGARDTGVTASKQEEDVEKLKDGAASAHSSLNQSDAGPPGPPIHVLCDCGGLRLSPKVHPPALLSPSIPVSLPLSLSLCPMRWAVLGEKLRHGGPNRPRPEGWVGPGPASALYSPAPGSALCPQPSSYFPAFSFSSPFGGSDEGLVCRD